MKKFLMFLLILCLGVGIAYAAVPKSAKKMKAKKETVGEVCDPNDPTCFQNKKISKLVDKSCGRGGRPLRVAGMIGNAPFGWVEVDKLTKNNKESFGLGRVVFDKIAKELGIRYVSRGYPSQEEAIRALNRGEIDMLLGVYYRNYGSNIQIIYPSYFSNVLTVYFKRGKEMPVSSYQDLAGLKGVIRKEELIYPLIEQKLPRDVHIQEVLSAPKVFEMLMNDEVDYIIGSPYAMEGELRRYKMQDDIISDGIVLGEPATLFFAFSKNSPCSHLKEEISESISAHEFSQSSLDSEIQKLIDDWGNRFRSDEVLMKTKYNTLAEDMDKETSTSSEEVKPEE